MQYEKSYHGMASTFGTVVVDVRDDDYQGDERFLLKSGTRWGVHVTGFGSCSGCDALEAAYYDEAAIEELRLEMGNGIKWFDTAQECKEYLTGKDWETHHSYREKESSEFVALSIAELEKP